MSNESGDWALRNSRFRTGPKQLALSFFLSRKEKGINCDSSSFYEYVMSRSGYGTFLDSLNSYKTELRSIGEATGADEVTL